MEWYHEANILAYICFSLAFSATMAFFTFSSSRFIPAKETSCREMLRYCIKRHIYDIPTLPNVWEIKNFFIKLKLRVSFQLQTSAKCGVIRNHFESQFFLNSWSWEKRNDSVQKQVLESRAGFQSMPLTLSKIDTC